MSLYGRLIAATAVAMVVSCAEPPVRVERAPAFKDTGTTPLKMASAIEE